MDKKNKEEEEWEREKKGPVCWFFFGAKELLVFLFFQLILMGGTIYMDSVESCLLFRQGGWRTFSGGVQSTIGKCFPERDPSGHVNGRGRQGKKRRTKISILK